MGYWFPDPEREVKPDALDERVSTLPAPQVSMSATRSDLPKESLDPPNWRVLTLHSRGLDPQNLHLRGSLILRVV